MGGGFWRVKEFWEEVWKSICVSRIFFCDFFVFYKGVVVVSF